MARQHRYAPNRLNHTDLSPLRTGQYSPGRYSASIAMYPNQVTTSPATPFSAISLASPTLQAVRQYYKDHDLTTAFQEVEGLRRNSVPLPQNTSSRRHSLTSPCGLTSRFGRVAVSSPLKSSQTPGIRAQPVFRSIAEESRNQLLDGVNGGELATLSRVVVRRKSSIQPSILAHSGQVPFEYAHSRLQQWGHAYLGNAGTADVFVKAVHLRRTESLPSQDPSSKDSGAPTKAETANEVVKPNIQQENIVIRARVTPRAKERKPFLLQRRFNIEELRANIPSPVTTSKAEDEQQRKENKKEEQSKLTSALPNHCRSKSGPTVDLANPVDKDIPAESTAGRGVSSSTRRVMPIHVEYAVHYLPVLGALMLCGHVRKGDAIDLPLPYPEAWADSVAYIYTGKGKVTQAIRENIMYLAGRIE